MLNAEQLKILSLINQKFIEIMETPDEEQDKITEKMSAILSLVNTNNKEPIFSMLAYAFDNIAMKYAEERKKLR